MNALLAFIFALWSPSVSAAPMPGEAGYQAPSLSVDLLRPSTDGWVGLTVDSARLKPGAQGSLLYSYAASPLVYAVEGQDRIGVVSDLTALWMTAATTRGLLRLGLTAPAYLRVGSDLQPPAAPPWATPPSISSLACPEPKTRPWASPCWAA